MAKIFESQKHVDLQLSSCTTSNFEGQEASYTPFTLETRINESPYLDGINQHQGKSAISGFPDDLIGVVVGTGGGLDNFVGMVTDMIIGSKAPNP